MQEKALCRAINNFRAQHGKPPLKVSVALTRAAEFMAKDMARHDNFASNHVDSHGRDFAERMEAFGYHPATKAENIAAGESTAAGDHRAVEELAGAPLDPPEVQAQGHGRRARAERQLGVRLVLDRRLRRHRHEDDAI